MKRPEARGPFDESLNGALSEAFGLDSGGLGSLSATTDDPHNDAIDAVASTRGRQMSFGTSVDLKRVGDVASMTAVGEEVAHALADGGSGRTVLDQPGDPGEARAGRAGEAFGQWMASGRRGVAPRLGPAHGGRALVHRKKKAGKGKKKDDAEAVDRPKGEIVSRRDTRFAHTRARPGLDPSDSRTVAAAPPGGLDAPALRGVKRTHTVAEGGAVEFGPVGGGRGTEATRSTEVFTARPPRDGAPVAEASRGGWDIPERGALGQRNTPRTWGPFTLAEGALTPKKVDPTTFFDEKQPSGRLGLGDFNAPGSGVRFRKTERDEKGGKAFVGGTTGTGRFRDMTAFRHGRGRASVAMTNGSTTRDQLTGTLALRAPAPSSTRRRAAPTVSSRANLKRFDSEHGRLEGLRQKLSKPDLSVQERDALVKQRNQLRAKVDTLRGTITSSWDRRIGGHGKAVMPGLTHDLTVRHGASEKHNEVSGGAKLGKRLPLEVKHKFAREKRKFASGSHTDPTGRRVPIERNQRRTLPSETTIFE